MGVGRRGGVSVFGVDVACVTAWVGVLEAGGSGLRVIKLGFRAWKLADVAKAGSRNIQLNT